MKKLFLELLVALLTIGGMKAQKLAIKNNLAYDVMLTPNLSLEVAMGKKFSLDTQFGANYFFYTTNTQSSSYKSKKFSHWLIQPELRYWTCDVFNGWFIGLHGLGGMMNVGGMNIPFVFDSKGMKDYRYEGWFAGGGFSLGYHLPFSTVFSMEASLGLGYAYIDYDKYVCATCGEKIGSGHANYVGPTKATLSLIFLLK